MLLKIPLAAISGSVLGVGSFSILGVNASEANFNTSVGGGGVLQNVQTHMHAHHIYICSSIYCSRIIVVHVHTTVFFSKVHPTCHNIANGIKAEASSTMRAFAGARCSGTYLYS